MGRWIGAIPPGGKSDGEGTATGIGEYRWPDGTVYKGDWKDGHCHGQGELRYADGAVYKGDWKDGWQQGQGECRYAHGGVYKGDYKACMKHGQGTMTHADGTVESGRWEKNKLVEPNTGVVRKLRSDLSSKATIHSDAAPAIRRQSGPTVAPGLPRGTKVAEFEWPDTAAPQLIISYATASARGEGLKYTWALSHVLRDAGYVAFHGKMVLGGANWQEQWYGLMPMSKVALVKLSQEYFQSKPCVTELRAICKQFDSDHILPVIVGDFSMRGEFLEHCDYLGPPFQRRKLENFIRQKIDGNWIPPPDQGLFQDNWAKNTATLLARIKALLK